MKPKEVLEMAAKFGLTNDIVGYNDFEKWLLMFAAELYAKAYQTGIMDERACMCKLMTQVEGNC